MEKTPVQKYASKTIGFYRNIFETTFETLMTLQEQMLQVLDNTPGLPDNSKAMISELNSTYKKVCADFKKLVDENFFKKTEELFAGMEKPAAAVSAESKPDKNAEPAKEA